MNHFYHSGEPVTVGDKVKIDQSATGEVVGVIDSGEYSGGLQKEHWDHYGTGVLVDSAELGLILYQEAKDIAMLDKIG